MWRMPNQHCPVSYRPPSSPYDFGMRFFLATGLLILVACSQPEPLQGIDLPPASLPEEIDAAQWAVAFSHEFGPGFWEEGPHAYQLFLDCPDVEQARVQSEVILFAAGPDIPTFDDPVRLRLAGLATTTMGSSDVRFVSTEQDTTALITVVGLSEEQVNAAGDCEGVVFWDEGESAPLQPNPPFRP